MTESRKLEKNFFVKSHGLGNDYVVVDPDMLTFELTESLIKKICDVHYGIGSDGLLVKVKSDVADFGLRIFNPDGSEAEKSGNGLRIFCKFLFDYGYTNHRDFTVETKGGIVRARIEKEEKGRAKIITVDMGRATFKPADIPVRVDADECVDVELNIGDKKFKVSCVSVGNPHCVVFVDNLDEDEVRRYGPLIERHPMFPNRTNVQFVRPNSREEVDVLIWERGAGYTLASGSSSCAVASVLVKKGLTDRKVRVNMPGGQLTIEVDDDFNIRMTGPVQEICKGVLSDELF